MLWAAVLRVSHLRGRDTESDRFHSITDQTSDIERAVLARGDTVHFLPPELDVSGGLPLEKRPALHDAVVGVEQGRYGGLVVAYLSRMGRDLRVLLEAWERIENAGGKVLVVREGIDTSTAAGRLHRDLIAAVDTNQREQAREAFRRRDAIACEQGIWRSRHVPIGYEKGPDRRLRPGDRARDVVRAYQDHGSGVTLIALSERLGITVSGVRHMLQNRVYLGELHHGDHVNLAAHEPLIDEQTWQRAQTEKPLTRPRSKRGPALLSGLARCASCGRAMGPSFYRGYYECRQRFSGGICPAPTGIRMPFVDEHVTTVVREHLARLVVTTSDSTCALDEARAELAAAEQELAAYLEVTSALDGPAFIDAARTRHERVKEAERRLAAIPPTTHAEWGTIADAFDDLNVHGRNQLLRGLLEAVAVFPIGRGRRVPPGERTMIVLHGAGVAPARPTGLAPIERLDANDERLIGASVG